MDKVPEDQPKEQGSFKLSCGAEKSSLRAGWYAISDGSFHPEAPAGIKFSPEVGVAGKWLSGEALIFPQDRAVGLIVGRAAELAIDVDLVSAAEVIAKYSGGATKEVADYVETMLQVDEAAKKSAGEGVEQLADFGDTGVSRHHLQIAYHPHGVTVVAYDPDLGRGIPYEQPRGERVNFPIILRQQDSKQASTGSLNWITFQGTATLRDGDVVVVKGNERLYCLRYFAGTDKRPPVFIKQTYPLQTTIEDLQRELIVHYAQSKKAPGL